MAIMVAGAFVIHKAVYQDHGWYGSGLAMAWGATVCWDARFSAFAIAVDVCSLANASSPSEMRPSFGFLRAQIGLAAFYASL
jgi:hypothetical protein